MVSVLMPCRNPGPYLDAAISSALAQPQLHQLIIADGGSTAEVQDCLRRWQRQDARVEWFSGADAGPADALNKALRLANSEWIGWLNADDLYQPGCLERALKALARNPQWQMIYGHGQHVNAEGQFLELYPSQPPSLGPQGFQEGCFICQPTVLLSKQLLAHVGGFDPQWRCAFDFDLWLRIFAQAPGRIGFIDALQASTRLHDATITANQQWRINLECSQLLMRSQGHAAMHWLESAAAARVAAHPHANTGEDAASIQALKLPAELKRSFLASTANLRAQQQLARGHDRINPRLPQALQTLLSSRSDLMALRMHTPQKERLFCNWLLAHGTHEYPHLFQAAEGDDAPLLRWLSQRGGFRQRLPRLSQAIWDRNPEHQQRWHRKKEARAYQQWLQNHWNELALPLPSYTSCFHHSKRQRLKHWLSQFKPQGSATDQGQPGVNLVGYATYALGIGEDLRTTYTALENAKVPVAVMDFAPCDDFSNRRDLTLHPVLQAQAPFSTTLVCLSPEEMLRLVDTPLGHQVLPGRYVIGYWPWELPHWPPTWLPALQHVDEVWVSSHHIAQALQPHTRHPVQVMPLCVESPDCSITPLTKAERLQARQRFELNPTVTLFCFSFDLNSGIERKNPWGCIRAFQRAFPPALAGGRQTDVGLVVKTHRPQHADRDWEALKAICQLDSRIHLIETTLERQELLQLYGCCDGFLSLHRAEGFGRGMAEALQLGLDVVATDWSGNADFCHGPLAHPVPATLIPVPPGAYPHWPDQNWADPDLDAAAQALQTIATRRQQQDEPETSVSDRYRTQFSAHTCGARYQQRLVDLKRINAT